MASGGKGFPVFSDVNVRQALSAILASPLQARICELVQQSKQHQAELTRICEDLERLQTRIRDIGSPKLTDATPQERDERQA